MITVKRLLGWSRLVLGWSRLVLEWLLLGWSCLLLALSCLLLAQSCLLLVSSCLLLALSCLLLCHSNIHKQPPVLLITRLLKAKDHLPQSLRQVAGNKQNTVYMVRHKLESYQFHPRVVRRDRVPNIHNSCTKRCRLHVRIGLRPTFSIDIPNKMPQQGTASFHNKGYHIYTA